MVEGKQGLLVSGDQNIHWDAPLKLAVAESRGIPLFHMVHSADQFSRRPTNGKHVLVSREACMPDGNISRWTAAMECAEFLGRCPLTPSELADYRIELGRLALADGVSTEEECIKLTASDWWGVHVEVDGSIAHDVPLGAVKEGYQNLKNHMKQSLRQTLDGDGEASRLFENMWSLFLRRSNLNVALGPAYMNALFAQFSSSTTTIGNSLTHFQEHPSQLLSFWTSHYGEVAALYNAAVMKGNLGSMAVDVGMEEIPFSLVVGEGGHRMRVDMTRKDAVRATSAGQTVIPKAICLFLELRLNYSLLLPEKGSGYSEVADIFGEKLQEKFPSLSFKPVVRIHFNALDNLAGVETRVAVPEYLIPFFGETVSGAEIAASWRGIVEEAKKQAKALRLKKPLSWLEESELISEETKERQVSLRSALQNREGMSEVDKRIAQAQVRAVEDESYRIWVQKMLNLLHVPNALTYWNARPMHWWTRVIPQWEDNIIANAKISTE